MGAHVINHSYKDNVLIPYVAITDNIFINKGDKVVTSDGVPCTIEEIEHLHICGESAEWWVTNLYKCDVWSFVKKWNSTMQVSSMIFLRLRLKRNDR